MIRIFHVVGLLAWFAWKLVLANLRVARDVLLPLRRLKPAILAIPLEPGDERILPVISNGISLTPGSLSLDVSPDRRYLYLHVMHVEDLEDFRRGLNAGYLRRIRRAFE